MVLIGDFLFLSFFNSICISLITKSHLLRHFLFNAIVLSNRLCGEFGWKVKISLILRRTQKKKCENKSQLKKNHFLFFLNERHSLALDRKRTKCYSNIRKKFIFVRSKKYYYFLLSADNCINNFFSSSIVSIYLYNRDVLELEKYCIIFARSTHQGVSQVFRKCVLAKCVSILRLRVIPSRIPWFCGYLVMFVVSQQLLIQSHVFKCMMRKKNNKYLIEKSLHMMELQFQTYNLFFHLYTWSM